MSLDLARIRAETPGTAHGIHLNNAGASLMPAPVVEAGKAHLDLGPPTASAPSTAASRG